jgi:hypothetical protein
MPRDRRGTVTMTITGDGGITDVDLCSTIVQEDCRILLWRFADFPEANRREIPCDIQWRATRNEFGPPPVVTRLRSLPSMVAFRWEPQGSE